MKTSNLILGASVLANIVLIGGFMLGAWGRPASSTAATGVLASSSTSGSAAASATATDSISATGQEWAALQTTDLAALRDRLRAEGFPPAVIRMIVSAQLSETFAAQRKALEAARGEVPFWKPLTPDAQTQAAMRAIDREFRQALTALLGPDPENGTAATLQRQFPDLAPDKIAQLASIRDAYEERRGDVYAGSPLANSPASREKINALDAAMRAEVAAILTPQELEDYDLRTSNTANQLRNNLTAFDATEEEFRTLFRLQQAFNDRLGLTGVGPLSPDQLKERNEAQVELNDQIKAALGDERFADYKRGTDHYYMETSKLVARLELPPETANQVWAVQQDIQQRVAALRTDRTLSPANRSQQLAALNEETATRVTAMLGERGFAAYKQYGGSWMQTLQPPRVAPGAASAVPPASTGR